MNAPRDIMPAYGQSKTMDGASRKVGSKFLDTRTSMMNGLCKKKENGFLLGQMTRCRFNVFFICTDQLFRDSLHEIAWSFFS